MRRHELLESWKQPLHQLLFGVVLVWISGVEHARTVSSAVHAALEDNDAQVRETKQWGHSWVHVNVDDRHCRCRMSQRMPPRPRVSRFARAVSAAGASNLMRIGHVAMVHGFKPDPTGGREEEEEGEERGGGEGARGALSAETFRQCFFQAHASDFKSYHQVPKQLWQKKR